MSNHHLWYTKPAEPSIWEEALPLGNGSLGAMIFGGLKEEHIQLNHETVWYGNKRNRINPSALETLPLVRDLLKKGKLEEAESLTYLGLYGTPMSQGHFEPLVDLKLFFTLPAEKISDTTSPTKEFQDYIRKLDLSTATHNVSFTKNAKQYTREAFISYDSKVLALKLTSMEDKSLNMRIELTRGIFYEEVHARNSNQLILKGASGGNGNEFCVVLEIAHCNGDIKSIGSYLLIENASEITIFLTGETNFEKENPLTECEKIITSAVNLGYDEIKKRHIFLHSELYNRVSLDISQNADFCDKPTDVRLNSLKNGNKDEGLFELYFNYGRYLLISSSRQNSLPANLQGIWNKEMTPPWGSKYTININTEMNYWHAETANLSECHEALFKHLLRMLPHGQEVASKMYACRGFVAHHNTDIFGDCAPQDQWMPATIWPLGAAWLTIHLLEHFYFNLDIEFLKKYLYVVEQASLFFIDNLIENEEGNLITSPSTSPENTYILENGQQSALCQGPTMDTQIIKQLWTGYLDACEILQVKNETTESISRLLPKLQKTKIGSRGQIMEWSVEYMEAEPGHRHISHLYALHPGNEITIGKSPALFSAAKKTLEERLSHGGGHTGWSRAWIVNMWARLLEAEKAYNNLQQLLTKSTASNLFDMHPPFQIDGNFGGTAGIIEMLVQSHEGFIRLLPACPSAWNSGSIKGIKARGAITIDMKWENGTVYSAKFYSTQDTVLKLLINNEFIQKSLRKGEIFEYCIGSKTQTI